MRFHEWMTIMPNIVRRIINKLRMWIGNVCLFAHMAYAFDDYCLLGLCMHRATHYSRTLDIKLLLGFSIFNKDR